MEKSIKVFAPASVTNLNCGFDVFGYTLNEPGDEIIIKIFEGKGVRISSITGDNNSLSKVPELNTAGKAVYAMLTELNYNIGVNIELNKKMPMGSGLGSSAASAVAATYALNEILDRPFTRRQLVKYALEGEKLTSGGVPHADNVTASLLGGFTAVRSIDPVDVFKIETGLNLFSAVVHPHIEIRTAETRKNLKKETAVTDAVKHWANTAAFVYALMKNNTELLARSLQDFIIEPQRAAAIPEFYKVKEAALKYGAIGSGISGSGPSIFALCGNMETAINAGTEMKKIYQKINLGCDLYISAINNDGPKVIG